MKTLHTRTHTSRSRIDIRIVACAIARDAIQAYSSWIHEHACHSAWIWWTVGILHANLWLSTLLPLQFRFLKCSVSNDFKTLPIISTVDKYHYTLLSFIYSFICNNRFVKDYFSYIIWTTALKTTAHLTYKKTLRLFWLMSKNSVWCKNFREFKEFVQKDYLILFSYIFSVIWHHIGYNLAKIFYLL